MVKIRYIYYYPEIKALEEEIQNAVLLDGIFGLSIQYEGCYGHPGSRRTVLGTVRNSEGATVFIASLVIDGTEYRAETIREHFAEVKALLDWERTEKLLQEIDDDQGSFEGV